MLRSKLIEDYREVRIEELQPGVRLPVDLHLYFSSNRHILIWRKSGEILPLNFVKKYRARGMKQVWIHREDGDTWRGYAAVASASSGEVSAEILQEASLETAPEAVPEIAISEIKRTAPGELIAQGSKKHVSAPRAEINYSGVDPLNFDIPGAIAAEMAAELSGEKPTMLSGTLTDPLAAAIMDPLADPILNPEISEAPLQMRTEEGQDIAELMDSVELAERQKTALVARAARQLLAETAYPRELADHRKAMSHARDAVRDILDSALSSAPPDERAKKRAIAEIWDLSALEPGLEHAVNVATLAVLFAMAFGRISEELISDIALAALLHDVGVTQIPSQMLQIPWSELKPRELQQFSRHVDEGLRLLDELAPGLSPRIRPLIQQHHEKFDGTGYPMQLHGHQVGDISQLIGMADAVESMASGQWDGEERELMTTLDQLELQEKIGESPEYFNPEVLTAVLRWVRDPKSLSGKLNATDVVTSTTRNLLKRG